MRVRPLLATALALALLGCGDDQEERAPPEDAAAATAPSPPAETPITVEVKADKTHAVQPGDLINLSIAVEGFTLDTAGVGAANEAGVGHYHVFIGSTAGEPLLVDAAGQAAVTVPEDITDGTHTLRVSLRNNDHSALDPPAEGHARLIVYRLD